MILPRTFFILRPRRQRAFSLVEITISLGIMAFALTGIVGMLSGSWSVNRAAASDSALTQIIRNVVESLRGQSMDQLVDWSAAGESQRTFYFSEDGSPLEVSGETVPSAAIYRCVVQADADPDTQSAASGGASAGAVNMVKLRLRIAWPYPAATLSKKEIYVHLARY